MANKKSKKIKENQAAPKPGNAGSMNHGIKNPGKVANKYNGWGTKKGSSDK